MTLLPSIQDAFSRTIRFFLDDPITASCVTNPVVSFQESRDAACSFRVSIPLRRALRRAVLVQHGDHVRAVCGIHFPA